MSNELDLHAAGTGFVAHSRRHRATLALVKDRAARYGDAIGIRDIDFDDAENEYPRAKRLVTEVLPELPVLRRDEEMLIHALTRKATEDEAAPILGAMLAAFPTASKITRDYAEALLELINEDDEGFDRAMGINGFSAAVLWATAKRLLRDDNFQPTIHRFLEVARLVRREFFRAYGTTKRLRQLRTDAEALIRIAEYDPHTDREEVPF
ncbi:MAG: hypothetical protein IOC86_02460 [Aestuariivirga sp.]|nr:hypothetical protein [Aestuariivirga sp.]